MKPLVAISFYDRRPMAPLLRLLDSLDEFSAGAEYQRVICINSTGMESLPSAIVDRVDGVLERENLGMNIGAWDAAYRQWPGRPAYVFLQDECYAVRDGWMSQALAAVQEPSVGLAGESFNAAWDQTWDELRNGPGKNSLPEHFVDGATANRVDVYLHHMRHYGIDPGASGRHLRSLAWAARGEVLASIGGFPQGGNYGECIAAEIGVSRAIEARGLALRSIGPSPFHVFRHVEWNQDKPGGPFTHKPVLLRELQSLREEVKTLRERLDSPSYGDLGRGLLARLGIREIRK